MTKKPLQKPRAIQKRSQYATLFFVILGIALLAYVVYAYEKKQSRINRKTTFKVRDKKETVEKSKPPIKAKILVNRNYLPELLKSIRAAKKEIYFAIYIADPSTGDSPKKIQAELIQARIRGVSIYGFFPEDQKENTSPSNKRRYVANRSFAKKLTRYGAKINFIPNKHKIHDKLVLIDSRIAFLGAHNWTQAALNRNNEISIRIRSDAPFTKLQQYFKRLKTEVRDI